MTVSRLHKPIRIALICAALGVALPAGAQMYKWTDDRGQVTYSNTPPPSASNKKVQAVEERVSVYTTDEETRRAISEEKQRDARTPRYGVQPAPQRARDTREISPQALASRHAAEYQRCVEQRRVDCESMRTGQSNQTAVMDYGYGYGVGEGYVYLPQHVVGAGVVRQPPFSVGESPIPRIGIDNRPPVGISTSPPIGTSSAPPVGAQPRSRTVGQFR